MLTCEQACDGLDLVLAGEDDVGVRQHVAACPTCRQEREVRAKARARLREGLASLSASPFLEDEVLEIARSIQSLPTQLLRKTLTYPTPIRVRRGPVSRLAAIGTAAAAIAAVAVFVFGPWFRRDGTPTPVGGGGQVRIQVAPSLGEVRAAREANRVALPEGMPGRGAGDGGVMLHASAGERAEVSKSFLGPWERVAHRWVYGDAEGIPGRRTFTFDGFEEKSETVLVLGKDLMRLWGEHLMVFDGKDEALVVLAGNRRWEALPGTSLAELTIGSPDEGGSEARIRVAVNPEYSGGILLTAPLAHALGLNQFEIPGGFEVEKTGLLGQRARARVRIPELGFDRVVEVQIAEADTRPVERLEFRGLRPVEVGLQGGGVPSYDRSPEAAEPGLSEVTVVERGPRNPTLRLRDGDRTETIAMRTYDVAPPPSDRTHSLIVEVARVEVAGTFEPGTVATFSRVWRGKTAIPSEEPVARTKVGVDGRLSFPRVVRGGETLLRMHLLRPDGAEEFRDVVVERPDGGIVTVTDEGGVAVVRFTKDPNAIPDEKVLGVIEDLKSRLRKIVRPRGVVVSGEPQGGMRVVLPAAAYWKWAQWTMMTAADPTVGIRDVELATAEGGAPLAFVLPTDAANDVIGPSGSPGRPTGPASLQIDVLRLMTNGYAYTGLRVGKRSPVPISAHGQGPYGRPRAESLEEFRQQLPAPTAGGMSIRLRISAAPPYGPLAAFGDVYDALRVARELGHTDVIFEGAPLPR